MLACDAVLLLRDAAFTCGGEDDVVEVPGIISSANAKPSTTRIIDDFEEFEASVLARAKRFADSPIVI